MVFSRECIEGFDMVNVDTRSIVVNAPTVDLELTSPKTCSE